MTKSVPRFPTLPFFFGVIFLLMGLFMSAAILFNLTQLPAYPVAGVWPAALSLNSNVPYPQRPEDCTYTQTYYSNDGVGTRQPSAEEQAANQQNQQTCLDSLSFNRQTALRQDVSIAVVFMVLGMGLLLTMPFYRV